MSCRKNVNSNVSSWHWPGQKVRKQRTSSRLTDVAFVFHPNSWIIPTIISLVNPLADFINNDNFFLVSLSQASSGTWADWWSRAKDVHLHITSESLVAFVRATMLLFTHSPKWLIHSEPVDNAQNKRISKKRQQKKSQQKQKATKKHRR